MVGARALPLYVRVVVDGETRGNAAILFPGRPPTSSGEELVKASYFGREVVAIDGLSVGPHQVSLLVGTDRSLANVVRGSTEFTIRAGPNTLDASIRFAGPREREVRLR